METDSMDGCVFPTEMESSPELFPPKPSETSTEQVRISKRGALSEVSVKTLELDRILFEESWEIIF